MSLIIDGYNLLHASGILGHGVGPGGLERSRVALLNFLVESLDAGTLARTIVVFDAALAPPGLPRQVQHRGLTVRFAEKHHDSADELIEELIRLDPAPRRLTVVSSDHRLHRAARRRKATPIDSDKWHAEIIRVRLVREKSPAHVPKPGTPLSDYDVRFWLQKFGVELPPADDSTSSPAAETVVMADDTVRVPESPAPNTPAVAAASDASVPRDSSAQNSDRPPAARRRKKAAPSRRPPHTDSSNPFPPGYADDIFDEEK